jgi:hypothetical protein
MQPSRRAPGEHWNYRPEAYDRVLGGDRGENLDGIGGGPRPGSGRSVWVFSARGRFAPKAPLLSVGFPWISLNSLVRIETFPWVTWHEARKPFSRAFSPALKSAGMGAAFATTRKRQDCSWGKLNLISDFLQGIVIRLVPSRPPQSKSSSL